MKKKFFYEKTIRLVLSLILFSFSLYSLLFLSTGDPALSVLRKSNVQQISPDSLAAMRIKLGISGNFFEQYLNWLLRFLKGDLGQSFQSNTSVVLLISEKIGITFKLVGISYILCIPFSLFLGSLIANIPYLKKSNYLFTLLLSIPVYWLAIAMIFVFGVQLQWFPFIGSSTPFHFVLPIAVLFFSECCYLTKVISDLLQTSVLSESQQIAKFRGIKWYYRCFYQLREIFIPLMTFIIISLIHMFGAVIIIETIFSISGIGKLLMDSISTRDYPVIQGITLIFSFLTFVLNYLADLMIQMTDSRIDIKGGGGK